jgi:Tol biopolymer transport system component
MRKVPCPLGCVVLVAVFALAGCGGSGAPTTESPSTAPSQGAVSTAATSPSATPLPTPAVAGTIAFSQANAAGTRSDIWVVSLDGDGLRRVAKGSGPANEHPSWSPDGKKIVYHSGVEDYPSFSLWVVNADGSGNRRLTRGAVRGLWPAWSPDGSHIAFSRFVPGSDLLQIAVMDADGSHLRTLTHQTDLACFASWASNSRLFFLSGAGDVFAVDLAGGEPAPITKKGSVAEYALSRSGTSMAVHDDSSKQVLVTPVEGGGTPAVLLSQVFRYVPDERIALSWAPAGSALAFGSCDWGAFVSASSIYVVNADGSGLSAIPGVETAMDPAWRPE